MPPEAQRVLRVAHRWVGLMLSLLLAVVAFTGTLLVFKDDWTRLTVPAARQPAALDNDSLAAVLTAAEAQLAEQGLSALRFGTEKLGVHRAYLQGGGGALLDRDGRVVARWQSGERLEDWLLDLHHRLLAGSAGHTVNGLAALVAVLLVASGLVLWWPARQSFRNRLWPRSSRRGELIRVHRDLGVWVSLPLAALCLTGAAMIFHTQSVALLSSLLGGEASKGAQPPPAPLAVQAESALAWRDVFEAGGEAFPGATARIVSWPLDGAPVQVRYRQPAEWHPNGRSVLYYQAGQGVIHRVDATGLGRGIRLFNTFYPLHSARIGGALYAAAVAATGLATTLLCLLAAWSFFKRPSARR